MRYCGRLFFVKFSRSVAGIAGQPRNSMEVSVFWTIFEFLVAIARKLFTLFTSRLWVIFGTLVTTDQNYIPSYQTTHCLFPSLR